MWGWWGGGSCVRGKNTKGKITKPEMTDIKLETARKINLCNFFR
jgi:hypothetical protein